MDCEGNCTLYLYLILNLLNLFVVYFTLFIKHKTRAHKFVSEAKAYFGVTADIVELARHCSRALALRLDPKITDKISSNSISNFNIRCS